MRQIYRIGIKSAYPVQGIIVKGQPGAYIRKNHDLCGNYHSSIILTAKDNNDIFDGEEFWNCNSNILFFCHRVSSFQGITG